LPCLRRRLPSLGIDREQDRDHRHAEAEEQDQRKRDAHGAASASIIGGESLGAAYRVAAYRLLLVDRSIEGEQQAPGPAEEPDWKHEGCHEAGGQR